MTKTGLHFVAITALTSAACVLYYLGALKTKQLTPNGDENIPNATEVLWTMQHILNFLIIETPAASSSGSNCSNIPVLEIVVFSAPTYIDRRTAIRTSWGASITRSIARVRFIVGTAELNETTRNILNEEQLLSNDLLFGNFVDSYENLTIKALFMLKWMLEETKLYTSSKCQMTHEKPDRFLLKIDDDTFLNVEELFNVLTTLRQRPLVLGSVISNTIPQRKYTSKWKPGSSTYQNSVYPNYLSGSIYLLSSDAVSQIVVASMTTPIFWVEDVYITGILTQKAGLSLVNTPKIEPFSSKFNVCLKQIACHCVTPSKMKALHREVLDAEKRCQLAQN